MDWCLAILTVDVLSSLGILTGVHDKEVRVHSGLGTEEVCHKECVRA